MHDPVYLDSITRPAGLSASGAAASSSASLPSPDPPLDEDTWTLAAARFCPHGFRRHLIARGPRSLVSLLAFEPGQCEHVHQHLDSDEHFHGVYGSGRVLVDDRWWPIATGLTHFRPRGAWHSVVADTRLLLLSVQAPIPRESNTVWHPSVAGTALRPEDREWLVQFRCCRCPRCGGHARQRRLTTPCPACSSARTSVRCENCHWRAQTVCLPATSWRAG